MHTSRSLDLILLPSEEPISPRVYSIATQLTGICIVQEATLNDRSTSTYTCNATGGVAEL
jgi:hypothetical protein